MRRANSSAVKLSQPSRHLTVTGTPAEDTAARTIASARAGSFISAEPSPLPVILGIGQPMLRSKSCAPESATALGAAARMSSGSEPKICAETGDSPPQYKSSAVFRSSNSSPLALTISVTVNGAPQRRQIIR